MKAILVFVVVLGVASIGWGQSYYKYVDKNGTVCFTENPNSEEVRGVVQKDGMKVLKDKVREGSTTVQDNKVQSGTKKRIMIKGQWVDYFDFSTKGETRTYYDAHPEERARDNAIQANKPFVDMQRKLNEDIRTREQGYGRGMDRDHPSPSDEEYRKKTYGLTPTPPHHQDDAPSVPAFHGKGTTYSTYGNTTFGSDGSTSFQFGNQTINSDSTITNQFGDTFYKSNGATSNRSGNMMYDSDGTKCTKIGNQTYCH